MQHSSHCNKTLIATVLEYVNQWRKSMDWSRETVAQEIVKSHESIAGPAVTGIRFDNAHSDIYTRQKNNADRIFRWLDDSSKDNNLLPVNFFISILAALPIDYRICCLNDILRVVSVSSRPMQSNQIAFDAHDMLKSILKENGEAERAIVELTNGATVEELMRASKEVTDVIVVATDARNRIEAALLDAAEK